MISQGFYQRFKTEWPDFNKVQTTSAGQTSRNNIEIKYNNINTKIKYEDECLGLSFSWKRQYTHNPEDPTSNSFLFLFSLKEIMEGDI